MISDERQLKVTSSGASLASRGWGITGCPSDGKGMESDCLLDLWNSVRVRKAMRTHATRVLDADGQRIKSKSVLAPSSKARSP